MARLSSILILQLIFIFQAAFIQATEKVIRPKFNDVKLWSDNKHVTHTITYDANDPHLNFTINVLEDLPDVDFHVEARLTQKADPTYSFAFNSTLNICRLLHWRSESPIGTLIHSYLKEFGHILETCPIVKGEYFMHKFWYPEDTASAVIPEFDFEINASAFVIGADKKRTIIVNDHISGEGVVHEVEAVKRGVLAMLQKSG